MLREYFEVGGFVMYLIFGAWVIVLAGVMDRLLFCLTRTLRRSPVGDPLTPSNATLPDTVRRENRQGMLRIDAVSQIATSLGLFGTVLGIARSFFARGGDLELDAPEVLASGLATALYTTVAGLAVFLFAQSFLVIYEEWLEWHERRLVSRGMRG